MKTNTEKAPSGDQSPSEAPMHTPRQGHTPGPWRAEETYQGMLTDKFKDFPFSINGADGFQPCLVLGDGKLNAGTAAANARLIAAAPALLAALEIAEATLQRLAPDGSRATQGTRDVITAALAKAKGVTL